MPGQTADDFFSRARTLRRQEPFHRECFYVTGTRLSYLLFTFPQSRARGRRRGVEEERATEPLAGYTIEERTNPAKESSVKTRITSARPAFNFSKDKTRLVWQMFQDPCLLHQQSFFVFSFLFKEGFGCWWWL